MDAKSNNIPGRRYTVTYGEKVFPGCSSCLLTKHFAIEIAIENERQKNV